MKLANLLEITYICIHNKQKGIKRKTTRKLCHISERLVFLNSFKRKMEWKCIKKVSSTCPWKFNCVEEENELDNK